MAINHSKLKNLEESTVRAFNTNYHVEINDAASKKRFPKKLLNIKNRRRPLLVKELNKNVQKYLIVARNTPNMKV